MRGNLAHVSKTGKQKSMKRKIALLLAFAMVLSILPMNVFGTGQATPIINRPTDNYGRIDGQVVDWTISINVADLRGQTAGTQVTHLVLPVTLSGAGDGYVRFVNEVPDDTDRPAHYTFSRLPIHDRNLVNGSNLAGTSPSAANHPQNRICMRATLAGSWVRDHNAVRWTAGSFNWETWNGAGIAGQGVPGQQAASRLRTEGSTDHGRNFLVAFVRTGHQSGYLMLRYIHAPATADLNATVMRYPEIGLQQPGQGPAPSATPEPFSYVIHAYPATLIPQGGIRFPHGTQIAVGSRIPATATELAAAGLISGTDFVFEDAGMVRFIRNAQINGNAIVIQTPQGYGALGQQFMGTFTIPRFRHSNDNERTGWTFPAAAGPISASSNGYRHWLLDNHGHPGGTPGTGTLPAPFSGITPALQNNLYRGHATPRPAGYNDRFLELANPANRNPNRVSGNAVTDTNSSWTQFPSAGVPRGWHTGSQIAGTTINSTGYGPGYFNHGTRIAINQDILVTTTAALTAPPLSIPQEDVIIDHEIIPLDATGQLRITMPPMRVRHTDARIRVNMHTTSGAVLVDRPLAAFPGTGLIVDNPTVVIFEHIAGLNNLTVREAAAGNFNRVASGTDSANGTGYLAFRFLAPPNYFWGVPVTEQRGRGPLTQGESANPRIAPRLTQAVQSVSIGRGGEVYRTTFQHPNGRHELVVIVPINVRPNTAVAAVPAAIRFEGLRLIPAENAPREGQVNIDVSVGRVRLDNPGADYTGNVSTLTFGSLPETLRLEHFFNVYANRLFWPTSNDDIHRANAVHVATRSMAELTLQTYGDEVYFRSGVQGNWMNAQQQYDGYQLGGRVTGAPGTYRTTQRLQLFENVPNALGLSPGAPVTFTFPEGVEILGVHYRIVNHANGNVINPWRTQWRNNDVGQNYWNQELSLSANVATFRHILEAVPAGGTLRRRLEIEFSLSVAPGFFGDHSDQIVVTAGGAGVNNLPTAARSIAIANVYDPIHVELLGGPLTFDAAETGRVHNLPGRVPVGDLLIAETSGGMLATGDTLIIYATGSFMPRVEDLAWHSGVARTDGNSGLRLSAPREVMVNVNGRLIRGVEFEIIGESSPDDDGGYITLSGNWVAGFVYPEEEYYIVVTGSAVGGTTQLMASYRAEDYGGRNTRSAEEGRSHGMFNMRPYGTRFVEFIDGGPQQPGDGTGTPWGPGTHLPQEIRILTTDPFTTTRDGGAHTINPPVVFREFSSVNPALSGGPTTSVGFVSLRVFADIAGAEILENYPGAGEVTIRGLHSDGQRTVTVTVRTGNRFIGVYVSGGTHRAWDIAEFSGHLTNVPYGQISTINYQDRLYLPFRAVANAFGYDLRVEGPVVIFG